MVDVSSRQIFDSAVVIVVSYLERACLPSFLASVHYNYVLALKVIMMRLHLIMASVHYDYVLALKAIMMTLL